MIEEKLFSVISIFQKLSEDKRKLCEEDLTKEDLCDSLKSIQNGKYPGNDGLT